MTREERAIMYFKDMRKRFCEDYLLGVPKDSVAYKATMAEKEFYDTAIEALKQEPCEDAISRQAVLEQTYLWSKGEFLRVAKPFDYLRKRINSLPSVTPKPKTDILDKIRTEIEQERVGYPPSADYYKAIIKCLQIIDKYKEESEE